MRAAAAEPEWNPAAIKACDRACLVGIMEGYMNAIYKQDPNALPPLAKDVRMTENTGVMDVGEGVLWRIENGTDRLQYLRCRSGFGAGRPAGTVENRRAAMRWLPSV